MALFAISDLHLAHNGDKPMEIFGDNWLDHDEKIRNNWLNTIKKEDMVLIAGDISWSLKMEDGIFDLDWVHKLPGEKILVKGNHDYWWSGISKLNRLYDDINFIQNNYFTWKDYAVCGTRGWICPGSDGFKEKDERIYKRELNRLELSINSALVAGYKNFIIMLHYPPTNDKLENSGFTDIIERYSVKKVVYGHIHGPFGEKGESYSRKGTDYYLTSCDFLDFNPIKLQE